VSWFLFGFLLVWAPLFVGLTVFVTLFINELLSSICGAILGCGFCCSGIAWFIFGLTTRFGAYGSYAAGAKVPSDKTEAAWYDETHTDDTNFQVSSGLFLKVYYIIILCMICIPVAICIIACCFACCGAAAGAAMGPSKESQESARS
jgi:hypothetical protein